MGRKSRGNVRTRVTIERHEVELGISSSQRYQAEGLQ